MSRTASFVAAVLTVAVVLTFAASGLPERAEALTGYDSGFATRGKGPGEFGRPGGMAFAPNGDLWIADAERDRIERLTRSGEYVTEFGSHGFAPDQLTNPAGIDVDPEGDVWVADAGHSAIKEYDEEGSFLRSLTTSGTAKGHLYGPHGVALDAEEDVWVADTTNHRIQEFDNTGKFLRVVSPEGLGSIEPANIAIGPEGVVWVTDIENDRIVAFSEAGALLHEVGSEGSAPGQFDRPWALDVDSEGNVWVEDEQNERVQKFSPEGELVAIFGSGGPGMGQFSFTEPAGIVVGPEERFWVTNGNAPVIQVWGPESQPTCTPGEGETRSDAYTREIEGLRCTGGGPVSYELVSGPEHGEVRELDSETGTFWYYPEPGFIGTDTFTFTATNGVGSATPTTFDMAVGMPPECHGYGIVIPAGQPYTLGPEPFSCEGEGILEYGVHEGFNSFELLHGELSEFDPKTGSVVYTPEPGFAGTDFFDFVAKNRFGPSPLDYVYVTVKNLPTCEDGSTSIYRGDSAYIELPCEGEGIVEWQIVSGPQHGQLSPFYWEDGRLFYWPEPEFEGTDSFTFKMVGEAGDSETKTFTVSVAGTPPWEEEGGGEEGESGEEEGGGEEEEGGGSEGEGSGEEGP